ncbi:MAG TPA: hypothetical protein VFM93_12635 [Candidatus Limnocylindria bacterium]|nr:hypothetical protein [Candidatus Limnocylindria bacterium]
MSTFDGSEILTLQEFRLHAADTDGTVARLVATASAPGDGGVPLLTSVHDPRDVATLRVVPAEATDTGAAGRERTLGGLVSSWQPARRYQARLAERAIEQPSSYRLAVTESGINDEQVAPAGAWVGDGAGEPVALLWIGIPETTHAGLMILVGRYDEASLVQDAEPLPLARALGVRIYESRREGTSARASSATLAE